MSLYVASGYWAAHYGDLGALPTSVEAVVRTIADASVAASGAPGVGLAPTNALVTMYELDTTALGGTVYRFHPGMNALKADLVWQGATYTAFPLEASGFEQKANGGLPRPTLRTSNVDGAIGALIAQYRDLVGAKVTRRRTLAMYLDAVNFPGGSNPTANPSAHFPDDVFFVDRKAKENAQMVEFELAAASDCHGVLIPNRAIVAGSCMWTYKGTECGYSGGPVATWGDVATSDPLLDSCGKRLSSCKLRFGATAILPYGGFPAAQRG